MDETNWIKNVVVALSVLLVVGALIGGIVAFLGLKAADVAFDTTDNSTHNSRGPVIPHRHRASTTSSSPTSSVPPSNSGHHRRHSGPPSISLTVTPVSAAAYARIDLDGTWPHHGGATLQVQRKEAGTWTDFPTTATVQGGAFHTYIETGHTGLNRLRVVDKSTGATSNTVKVRIG